MLKWGNKTPMLLRGEAASNIAGTVKVRGFTRSGIIEFDIVTTADGKLAGNTLGISDFPIMLSITDPANAYLPNQCWSTVELEINEEETISLCSGFVFGNHGPTWPATTHISPVPGRGHFVEVQSADPAVNTETSITVPDGELWHVLAMSVTLVSDANGGERKPHFVFTYPTGVIIDAFAATTQGVSITRKYSVAKYGALATSDGDNDIAAPLPHEIFLPPTSTITTETENLRAGDNYGKLSVQVEKFFGFDRN